jgi:hypothetical protein
MASLSDAIPLCDLERIAALEESAYELERKANRMLFDAQDMRYQAEAIRESYRVLVEEVGLEACVRNAKEMDGRSWNTPMEVA